MLLTFDLQMTNESIDREEEYPILTHTQFVLLLIYFFMDGFLLQPGSNDRYTALLR